MLSVLRGKIFASRIDREMRKQERSPFRSGYTPKHIVTENGIDRIVSIGARGVTTLHTAFDANARFDHILPEKTEDEVIDVTWREI